MKKAAVDNLDYLRPKGS